jgi:putative copper export protein
MLFNTMHIIHLLTVILWIGGLSFITTMIFPIIIKTEDPLAKVLLFRKVEHRFARTARIYNLVTGASGLIMVLIMGWQKVLFTGAGLPLLIMVLIWVFWFVMLFGLEPLVIRKMLERMMKNSEKMDIDAVFSRMNRMHWFLLVLSFVAATGGAVFAHGFF